MTPEEELLEEIRREYPEPNGEVVVHPSSDEYFRTLERRFPVVGSQIAWSRVPGARVQSLDTVDSERYFDQAEEFAREVWAAEDLDRERPVMVIGDSAMEVALEMSPRALMQCLRNILRMPQHTYVLAPDASWCMVFNMEGDVCFGYAPR